MSVAMSPAAVSAPSPALPPSDRSDRSDRSDFSGLWIPLVTPFADGDVDHPALKRLAAHYHALGVAGLVVCGTTAEAAALDDGEQLAVLATVRGGAPGLPLVIGLTGYHLGKTAARIAEFNALGLTGILLPAPHYIRPSQAGLVEWFTRLADASDVPLIVYDIPYRTGATLSLGTLLTLAAHPRIRGIKDCGGDAAKTAALIADGRLQVLCGEDVNVYDSLARGAHGVISAAAHVQTARFLEIMRLIRNGESDAAHALWLPLQALITALFAEPNPAPVKALLAAQGRMAPGLRSPMMAASPELVEQLVALDAALTGAASAVGERGAVGDTGDALTGNQAHAAVRGSSAQAA